MEPVSTLVTQGGLGIMAGVFLWLYIQERKEHKATRDKYEKSLDDRRVDAKEVQDTITPALQSISQNVSQLNDKIVLAQSRKR